MSATKLYRLRSKFDGLGIIMREWACNAPAKAVIILVHGIGEHSKVYKSWAKRFNQEGYNVVSFDLRGHGLSGGKRGHIPIYRAYMSDLSMIYRQVKTKYPSMPIMLYGHSLGGNIVLHFLLKKRKFIIGAVASSPWLTLAFEPPFYKVLIGRIVGLFWPEYSDSNKTSLEADVILDKNADPLLHDKISITTYLDCKKAGKRILQKATALSPPILLMHGTKDQRTSWTSTAKLGSRLSHPLSKFISFKGAGHELHEFKKRLEVYNTVSEWMKNVLKNQ